MPIGSVNLSIQVHRATLEEVIHMNKKNNGSASVTWVLIALLAAIFVIVTFVNESYRSGALYIALVATLAALALIGFHNRRDW